MKLLFYCHNVHGLGHITRSLRIAEAALETASCECCIITGCRFLDHIPIDSRIRVVSLPPVQVSGIGRFSAVGDEDDNEIIKRRSQQLRDFCKDWRPDAVLVDHNPLGLGGELMETLHVAHREGWNTRFIWGIRDIYNSPDLNKRPMRRPRNPDIIRALEHYESAIAYSDRHWIATLEYYPRDGLPAKTGYVGIVAGRILPSSDTQTPILVGLTGGGTGAEKLFKMLVDATEAEVKRGSLKLRFVVGPFTSADTLKKHLPAEENIEIWPEGTVEKAIQDASIVVSRVGYNTAYTVVQTDLPIVLVPLKMPGDEQGYRARLLAQLPNVLTVDEGATDATTVLATNIRHGLEVGRVKRELPFRIDGARQAAEWVMSAHF
jgi:predicted glycosyltransferase